MQITELKLEVEKSKSKKPSTEPNAVAWGNDSAKSLTELVKETAEQTLATSGFVFDEKTGLYFDYSSGYYYDPVRVFI